MKKNVVFFVSMFAAGACALVMALDPALWLSWWSLVLMIPFGLIFSELLFDEAGLDELRKLRREAELKVADLRAAELKAAETERRARELGVLQDDVNYAVTPVKGPAVPPLQQLAQVSAQYGLPLSTAPAVSAGGPGPDWLTMAGYGQNVHQFQVDVERRHRAFDALNARLEALDQIARAGGTAGSQAARERQQVWDQMKVLLEQGTIAAENQAALEKARGLKESLRAPMEYLSGKPEALDLYVPEGQAELSANLLEMIQEQVKEAGGPDWNFPSHRWHMNAEWLAEVKLLRTDRTGLLVFTPKTRTSKSRYDGHLYGYPVEVGDAYGAPDLVKA